MEYWHLKQQLNLLHHNSHPSRIFYNLPFCLQSATSLCQWHRKVAARWSSLSLAEQSDSRWWIESIFLDSKTISAAAASAFVAVARYPGRLLSSWDNQFHCTSIRVSTSGYMFHNGLWNKPNHTIIKAQFRTGLVFLPAEQNFKNFHEEFTYNCLFFLSVFIYFAMSLLKET